MRLLQELQLPVDSNSLMFMTYFQQYCHCLWSSLNILNGRTFNSVFNGTYTIVLWVYKIKLNIQIMWFSSNTFSPWSPRVFLREVFVDLCFDILSWHCCREIKHSSHLDVSTCPGLPRTERLGHFISVTSDQSINVTIKANSGSHLLSPNGHCSIAAQVTSNLQS